VGGQAVRLASECSRREQIVTFVGCRQTKSDLLTVRSPRGHLSRLGARGVWGQTPRPKMSEDQDEYARDNSPNRYTALPQGGMQRGGSCPSNAPASGRDLRDGVGQGRGGVASAGGGGWNNDQLVTLFGEAKLQNIKDAYSDNDSVMPPGLLSWCREWCVACTNVVVTTNLVVPQSLTLPRLAGGLTVFLWRVLQVRPASSG
jgi:hypothetical protein